MNRFACFAFILFVNMFDSVRGKSVLFVTIMGHTPSVLAAATAKELRDRNSDVMVKLIGYDIDRNVYLSYLRDDEINAFNFSNTPLEKSSRIHLNRLTGKSNLIGIPKLIHELAHNYENEVIEIDNVINSWKPDLMVIDQFGTSAIDYAAHHQIPYAVLYHAGVLGIAGIEDSFEYPDALLGTKLADQSLWNRLKRIFVFMQVVINTSATSEYLNNIRKKLGFVQYNDPTTNIIANPFLVFSSYALEYARPVSPLTRFVGSYIDRRHESYEPQSESDHEVLLWLNESAKPVVFIQFGTEMEPEKNLLESVIDGVVESGFRLLMAIRDSTLEDLQISRDQFQKGIDSSVFKFIPWARSKMILKHDHVVVFICHGGIQSTMEGIYSLKPMIFLPAYADRHGISARLEDRGMVIRLDHSTISKEKVKNALVKVLDPKYVKEVLKKYQLFIRVNDRHGTGAIGAAMVIEEILDVGYEYRRPITLDMSPLAKGGLDAILVILGTIFIIVYFIFKGLKSGIRSIFAKKKKQA